MADRGLFRAPDEWFVVSYYAGHWWQRYAVVRFRDGRFEFAHEDGERSFYLRASKAEEQAEWLNFVDGLTLAIAHDAPQRWGLTTKEAAADAVERGVADFKAAALAALDRSHRGCG